MREGARNAGPGSFRFCPVIVPPVTVDQLKARKFVSASYFGMVNWIAAASPAGALTALNVAFDGLAASPSPFEALEAQVGAILAPIGKPAVYQDAAREAGFDPADLKGADPAAGLARLYMRCSIERLCASLGRLENVLGYEPVQRLFDLLAPCWVSFEAGRRFEACLCVTDRAPANRFAVLNGLRVDFTPLMYLMRALGKTRRFSHLVPVMPPDAGGLWEAAFLKEVDGGLKEYVARYFGGSGQGIADELSRMERAFASGDRQTFEKLLATFVRRLVRGGGAVVVAVPAGPEDFASIKEVSSRAYLERVTFVALCGHHDAPPGDSADVIVPELSPEYEELAYDAFSGFTRG